MIIVTLQCCVTESVHVGIHVMALYIGLCDNEKSYMSINQVYLIAI